MEWPKITAETTVEELQRVHRVIWQYAVENGHKPVTPYEADCPACEYVRCRYGSGNTCDFCPINWGDLGYCTDPLSVFYMWISAIKQETTAGNIMAMRLAAIIRDVKFRD